MEGLFIGDRCFFYLCLLIVVLVALFPLGPVTVVLVLVALLPLGPVTVVLVRLTLYPFTATAVRVLTVTEETLRGV
jgi:hypothetical protein